MDTYEAIVTRRSTRSYRPDPVEPEKLRKIIEARRHARRGNVALALETRLLGEDRVEHGVRYLVADLVGMTLGHRLGGKEIVPGRHVSPFLPHGGNVFGA